MLNINPPDVMMPELKLCWKTLLDLVRGFIAYFKPYTLRRDILQEAYNEILKEKARLVQMQKDKAKARMKLMRKARRTRTGAEL